MAKLKASLKKVTQVLTSLVNSRDSQEDETDKKGLSTQRNRRYFT